MKRETPTLLGIRLWAAACTLGITFGLIEAAIKWISMLLGVPKPMSHQILWVVPAFYGLLATIAAIGMSVAMWIVMKLLRLPQNSPNFASLLGIIHKLAPLLLLGAIFYLGFHNQLTQVFSTRRLAGMILALGLAYQATRFFAKRQERAVPWLAGACPWLVGLVVVLALAVYGGKYAHERFMAKLPLAVDSAPNVLLITLDTLRADHISSYGYHRPTPNLDRLASEGLQFDYAMATSSWTLPSHATMMTGRYTYEHMAEMMTGQRLDDKYPNLAEGFAENGYATAAFVANESVCAANQGFGRGFGHYNDLFWGIEDMIRWTNIGEKISRYVGLNPRLRWYQMGRKTAAEVNREFVSWLPKRENRPFFVWLNYFDPHDPYYAPPPFDTKYGKEPARGNPGSFGVIGASEWFGQLTPEESERNIDAYDCAIAYLDTMLGRLFEELRQQSLEDHTIIIITSDHGEAFGEHGFYGHSNSLYHEVLHVPLMIRYPKSVPVGGHVTQPVSLRDLPATISALAGLKLKQELPGQRLDIGTAKDPVLAELLRNPHYPALLPVSRSDLISFTSDQWHAIFHNDQVELYARDDERQQVNMAETVTGIEAVRELREQFQLMHPQRQFSSLQTISEGPTGNERAVSPTSALSRKN